MIALLHIVEIERERETEKERLKEIRSDIQISYHVLLWHLSSILVQIVGNWSLAPPILCQVGRASNSPLLGPLIAALMP